MNKEFFWYGFRQTRPSPVGGIVICGPFKTYDEAKRDRENSKDWDCQVGIPFNASSKDEAMKQVKTFMP